MRLNGKSFCVLGIITVYGNNNRNGFVEDFSDAFLEHTHRTVLKCFGNSKMLLTHTDPEQVKVSIKSFAERYMHNAHTTYQHIRSQSVCTDEGIVQYRIIRFN